jgi:hypothetical protein
MADTTFSAFTRLDLKDPRRKWYFSNFEVLNFMRCVLDCVLLAWQEVKLRTYEEPGTEAKRAFRRLKNDLVLKPYETAKLLKLAAGEARAWYFGAKMPKCRFRRIIPTTKWGAMIFSYIARALPAPSESAAQAGLQELEDRLCGGDTIKDTFPSDSYQEFVGRYLRKFKPKALSLWSMPSSSASLGYKRSDGGHLQAVQGLVALGFSLNLLDDDGKTIARPFMARLQEIAIEFKLYLLSLAGRRKYDPIPIMPEFVSKETLYDMLEQSANSEFWRQCLTLGAIFCMESLDSIPVLPIAAGEKGLKWRYPTITHVAANMVYQILRRALEQHMILDPRCSQGLGGNRKPKFGSRGPWYSQDATFATDLHTFELTRAPYEQLILIWPELGKYARWFDKLFGPKRYLLVLGKDIKDAPAHPFNPAKQDQTRTALVDITERMAVGVFRGAAIGHGGNLKILRAEKKRATAFVASYKEWLGHINDLPHKLTTNGGMMGDATSFPIMELQSAYALEKAGLPEDSGELVGDDVLFGGATPEVVSMYEHHFLSLGGRLSKAKTFVNKDKGLLTEQPVWRGKKLPYTLLSMWSAPPGGSKGTLNPISQVTTLVDFYGNLRVSKKRALWRKTPFRQWHRCLFALGVPLGAPPDLGGLNHPTFAKRAGNGLSHQRWLRCISQLTLAQLATGTGLNLLMPSATSRLRKAGRQGVKDMITFDRENRAIRSRSDEIRRKYVFPDKWVDPTGFLDTIRPVLLDKDRDADLIKISPPRSLVEIDKLVDRILGPIQSWEFYFRETLGKASPRPAILSAARRFRDRVRKSKPLRKRFATAATLHDIERKRNCLARMDELGQPHTLAPRAFGLEPNAGPKASRDAKDKTYITPTGDLTGRPSHYIDLRDVDVGNVPHL